MVHIKKLINKLLKKQMETVDPQPRSEMRIKFPDWVLGARLACQQGPPGPGRSASLHRPPVRNEPLCRLCASPRRFLSPKSRSFEDTCSRWFMIPTCPAKTSRHSSQCLEPRDGPREPRLGCTPHPAPHTQRAPQGLLAIPSSRLSPPQLGGPSEGALPQPQTGPCPCSQPGSWQ